MISDVVNAVLACNLEPASLVISINVASTCWCMSLWKHRGVVNNDAGGKDAIEQRFECGTILVDGLVRCDDVRHHGLHTFRAHNAVRLAAREDSPDCFVRQRF